MHEFETTFLIHDWDQAAQASLNHNLGDLIKISYSFLFNLLVLFIFLHLSKQF